MTSRRRVKVQETISKRDVERFKNEFKRLGRIQTRVGNQQLSAILGMQDATRQQNAQTLQDERQLSSLSANLNAVRSDNLNQQANRLSDRRNMQATVQNRLDVLLGDMLQQSQARYSTNQARQQQSLSNLLNYTR